jgi:hypothetical protein
MSAEDEETSPRQEYYLDWLSDHRSDLKDDFVDEHEDEFGEYCRKKFGEDEK